MLFVLTVLSLFIVGCNIGNHSLLTFEGFVQLSEIDEMGFGRFNSENNRTGFTTITDKDVLNKLLDEFSNAELQEIVVHELYEQDRPTTLTYTIRMYSDNRMVYGIDVYEEGYLNISGTGTNSHLILNEVSFQEIIRNANLNWISTE